LSQSLYFSATDGSVFIWAINAVLGNIRRIISLKDQFCLCLFSVYMNDLPSTCSHKFIYADDICLATQDCTFTALEDTLSEDLDKVAVFLRKWRLQPSVPKTLSCVFHLHNATASLRKP